MNNIKAIILDRDGTIIVDKKYVYKIEDFELIPKALDALRLLTLYNIKIYIITNQAGIAKGLYTEEQYHVFNFFMLDYFKGERINIEKVLYCPHHPNGIVPRYSIKCNCRKPNTGLIEEIFRFGEYKIEEAVLIGDKNSDIDAGKKLGIKTYLVLTGYGKEYKKDTKADFVIDDLFSAITHVLMDR